MSQIPPSSIWMMVYGVLAFVFIGIDLGITSGLSVAFASPPVTDQNVPSCDPLQLCLNVVAFHFNNAAAIGSYYLGVFGAIFGLLGNTGMVLITGDFNGDGTQELPFPFNTMILAAIAIPTGIGLIQLIKGWL